MSKNCIWMEMIASGQVNAHKWWWLFWRNCFCSSLTKCIWTTVTISFYGKHDGKEIWKWMRVKFWMITAMSATTLLFMTISITLECWTNFGETKSSDDIKILNDASKDNFLMTKMSSDEHILQYNQMLTDLRIRTISSDDNFLMTSDKI